MALAITLRQIKEAALSSLGLIMYVVADEVDTANHTVKSSDVANKSPDPYLVRDAYFVGRESNDTGNQWRRIIDFNSPQTPDTLKLQGGPDGISNGDDCAIYLGLNPEEVKSCVNEALSEMWKRINIPFDFTENDNDYPCDDMDDPESSDPADKCTWITTRGQIETVKTSWEIQTNVTNQQEFAGYIPIENNNSVTLHFNYLPPATETSQISGILVANKPYVYVGATLDEDDDTTNCPMMLAQHGTCVKIIRLMYKKFGTEAVRARFGATLAVEEAEWAKAKTQYMPPLRASSYLIEETFAPDIPWIMRQPSW